MTAQDTRRARRRKSLDLLRSSNMKFTIWERIGFNLAMIEFLLVICRGHQRYFVGIRAVR